MPMYFDVCHHPGLTLLLSCLLNCLYCIVQHVIYSFVFTSVLCHFLYSLVKIVYNPCANCCDIDRFSTKRIVFLIVVL